MRYLALLLALAMSTACAEQPAKATPNAAAEVEFEAQADLALAKLREAFPGIPVGVVEPSPIPGMILVQVRGEWLHMTPDGRFLIAGELFELRDNGPVSLVEERQQALRVPGLAALNGAELISFPAAREKAEVYIFTDVTCGYCRQLHRQMADYNRLGITVHYLAFPRGGVDSDGAEVLNRIWCSADRAKAMTEAKLQQPLSQPASACDTPVEAHYKLGEVFGVRGTPAVFGVDGKQLGGYVPPARLAADLGLR
jgi:thiol:disulfide interchange protein DsbC